MTCRSRPAFPLSTSMPYLASMDDTYAMLGDLLAMPTRLQGRADYCRFAYDRIVSIADSVDKVNLLYITGDEGLNVIAQGSFHAEVIDLLSNNLAMVDEPSSKGTGNEVDMEPDPQLEPRCDPVCTGQHLRHRGRQ